jgi:hypothetical protein
MTSCYLPRARTVLALLSLALVTSAIAMIESVELRSSSHDNQRELGIRTNIRVFVRDVRSGNLACFNAGLGRFENQRGIYR